VFELVAYITSTNEGKVETGEFCCGWTQAPLTIAGKEGSKIKLELSKGSPTNDMGRINDSKGNPSVL